MAANATLSQVLQRIRLQRQVSNPAILYGMHSDGCLFVTMDHPYKFCGIFLLKGDPS
jgi:hypothetical protein